MMIPDPVRATVKSDHCRALHAGVRCTDGFVQGDEV